MWTGFVLLSYPWLVNLAFWKVGWVTAGDVRIWNLIIYACFVSTDLRLSSNRVIFIREIEVAIFSELLGAASHPTSMGLAVPHISAQFLFGSVASVSKYWHVPLLGWLLKKSKCKLLLSQLSKYCVQSARTCSSVQFLFGSVNSLQIVTSAFKNLPNTSVTCGGNVTRNMCGV